MRTQLVILAGLMAAALPAQAQETARMMELIPGWVGGQYSSKAQFEADQASDRPEHEKHRLMYQLFKRIEAPAFPGVVYFEQGSRDGSTDPDMIWRSALAQLLPDEALGVVRYRELSFKEPARWRNAHLRPEELKALSAADVTWNPDCDFLLKLDAGGRSVSGAIPKMKCARVNEGTGEPMYADDRIVITPDEFWFLGRFVDAQGRHVWGNESDELSKLVRYAASP